MLQNNNSSSDCNNYLLPFILYPSIFMIFLISSIIICFILDNQGLMIVMSMLFIPMIFLVLITCCIIHLIIILSKKK